MARNVILDVDTGSDDACAIMLAALSEELNVLGVCAVNGNRPLSDTLTNTLKIIELLKMEDKIPVVKGAAQPLVRDLLAGRNKEILKSFSVTRQQAHSIRRQQNQYLSFLKTSMKNTELQ